MMNFILTLLPSILVALLTAFFSARFYSHKAKADLQKELESRFNERKWEIYTKFSNTLRKIKDGVQGKNFDRKLPQYTRELSDFTSSLWLIGSDDVVIAFNDWQSSNREVANKENTAPDKSTLIKLMNILIAMRKDLGNKSTKVSPKDLLATFVLDVDEIF